MYLVSFLAMLALLIAVVPMPGQFTMATAAIVLPFLTIPVMIEWMHWKRRQDFIHRPWLYRSK